MIVAGLFPHEWLHPGGNGYWFYSGIFLAGITPTAFLAGIATYWRKHNCHVHRCWRLSWHPHPRHGHPVCGTHHPDHPKHAHPLAAAHGDVHILDGRWHRYGKGAT